MLDEGVILREQGAKLAEEGIGAGAGGRGWGRADRAFWMHFSAIFPEKYRTRTEFEERLVAENVAGRGELWRQEKGSYGCQTRFCDSDSV